MKRFLNFKNYKLITLVGGLLAITFFVYPVLAQEMTAADKLQKAEELSARAAEMAAEARASGDVELVKKALELVCEALVLVSEVAIEAKDPCNVELVGDALKVATAAANVISGIAEMAKETSNADLGQGALNMANNVRIVIPQVIGSAQYVAQTCPDPGIVASAKEIMKQGEETQDINDNTIAAALDSGAVPGPAEAYERITCIPGPPEPYEPPAPAIFYLPFGEEPPIQDTASSSPI